jgi:hypothetical protein
MSMVSLKELRHLDLTGHKDIDDASFLCITSLIKLKYLSIACRDTITDNTLGSVASLQQLPASQTYQGSPSSRTSGSVGIASLQHLHYYLNLTRCDNIVDRHAAVIASSLRKLTHLRLS